MQQNGFDTAEEPREVLLYDQDSRASIWNPLWPSQLRGCGSLLPQDSGSEVLAGETDFFGSPAGGSFSGSRAQPLLGGASPMMPSAAPREAAPASGLAYEKQARQASRERIIFQIQLLDIGTSYD